jgi:hypothetical protein
MRILVTSTLLKSRPHIKYGEVLTMCSMLNTSKMYVTSSTSGDFINTLEDEHLHVGNYEEQYTRQIVLHSGKDQLVLEYSNTFHTLHTNMCIKDSKKHLVLKYRNGLHNYIQPIMEFLDISLVERITIVTSRLRKSFDIRVMKSLGTKIFHNKRRVKVDLILRIMDKERINNLKATNPTYYPPL